MGGERRLLARPRAGGRPARPDLLHRHPAAQHHRLAARRPCAEQHAAGRADPLRADARQGGAVDARNRPRRHRHPDGGRASARRRGQHVPPRAWPRGLRRADLALEGRIRGRDRRPAAPPGRLLRLEPRALHPGRGPLGRRAQGVCQPLQAGADLPRHPPGQLAPGAADRDQRPRGREHRGQGPHVAFPLSDRGLATNIWSAATSACRWPTG